MTEKRRKRKRIEMQVNSEIYELVKGAAQQGNKSVNRYIIDLVTDKLSTELQDKHEIKEEKHSRIQENKITEYRIRFTESEAKRLKQYAQSNGWSVPKEIRYRVIGTMEDAGKISPEELELLKTIRISINAVGNNINRIIRDDRVMDQEGAKACMILSNNIGKVRNIIIQINEKSKARFSLKKVQ